ncbi:MAG: efflux RND transporter periplasmic adaptor subunit [Bacteroidales bacterium]|nr:efflux RND transporter periplasmic adaptor subunit [Bacteroidales bacterium]
MKAKSLSFNAFLFGIASVGLLTSCSGSNQSQTQQQAPAITVMTVEPTTSHLDLSYPAVIKGKTDIEIRPQATGFISKVCVDEGDYVRKGQTLFILDQVQYQAAVDQAKASVASAQVAVDNAQIQADNQKRLYDKNIISESQYITSVNSLNQAKAQLNQAKAALTNAEKNLSYTIVTSPSDGVVGSIPNREGSLASPSSAQALTTVSDNKQLYAYFSLNEKDLLTLTNNGAQTLDEAIKQMPKVKLLLPNGDIYPYEGEIATVSGVINNTTGAASVRALFSNENGMLRSGSTGQILIPEDTPNALVIPQKATFELQDRRYVYVVKDDNTVEQAVITVLDNNDGKNYVVTSGIEPGQTIVIEGVGTKVKNGSAITPVTAEQAAAAAAQQQQQQAQ